MHAGCCAEEREQVATELKRFASDLNLTEDQKEKLHVALTEARVDSGGLLSKSKYCLVPF